MQILNHYHTPDDIYLEELTPEQLKSQAEKCLDIIAFCIPDELMRQEAVVTAFGCIDSLTDYTAKKKIETQQLKAQGATIHG